LGRGDVVRRRVRVRGVSELLKERKISISNGMLRDLCWKCVKFLLKTFQAVSYVIE